MGLVFPDPSLTAGDGGAVLPLISTQMLSVCGAGLGKDMSAFSVVVSVAKIPNQPRL